MASATRSCMALAGAGPAVAARAPLDVAVAPVRVRYRSGRRNPRAPRDHHARARARHPTGFRHPTFGEVAMYRNILVAYDGSPESKLALDECAHLLPQAGREIHV